MKSDFLDQNQFKNNLGIVATSNAGLAQRITVAEASFKVYAHAANLPELQAGDEVLFEHTRKGAVILAATKPVNSVVQVDDEFLLLNCGASKILLKPNGEISLKNSKAEIKLLVNGDVSLESNNLIQQAKRDVVMDSGNNILLNCN